MRRLDLQTWQTGAQATAQCIGQRKKQKANAGLNRSDRGSSFAPSADLLQVRRRQAAANFNRPMRVVSPQGRPSPAGPPTGEGMETIKGARACDAASSGGPTDWHSIEWKLVMNFVGKAQTRIAQAEQDEDYRRVKRLQRSLVRSWQAKALAVRKVTDNQGKRTSGVDRVLWETPEAKWHAVCRLNPPGYRARALRRVYIPKVNGKERPLGIPTMFDRAMQALYLLALEPVAECASDPNCYGFRQGRSTHDARDQLFLSLSKRASAQWIFDADITGFFDNINHEWLLRKVHMNRRVLQQWLKSGVVERRQLERTEMGTPQGGVISPTLANITLNGLESGLKQFLKTELGSTRAAAAKVNVVRYADDFVVTGDSKELLETTVRPWVVEFLSERGLTLSEEKTRVAHIDEGFDFLGWNFRKYRGKMLIKPSSKNAKAFYGKVKGILDNSLSVPKSTLITRLNPVLRGWAEYHKGVVAKAAFSRLDQQIYWRLMRWGLRRHPRKSSKWVLEHYWQHFGTRHVFAGRMLNRKEEEITVSLHQLADTKIVRHVKVKGDYNPFDPRWEQYGERLRVARMSQDIWDHQRLKLWMEQAGRCALCDAPMDDESAIEDHHILYRRHGGSDALANRVLLHPVCHRRVHALGLEVTKPVPAQGLLSGE
jgi:RNA-directed DNA polymerase